jgi:adenylosuccinate lyase
MRRVLSIARRDLTEIERALLHLAAQHRDTVMLGRTHGQPGVPITFGFKAAGWAAEIRRHLERIEQAEPRLVVGQLAGAVGTLSSWGDQGLELQRRVLTRLNLNVPDTSWLTARDRIAEFNHLLALATGTLAKIGHEVYNLQRPEIGELSETPTQGAVGSITMPQKRNPELSEHLGTLARVVRGAAALALEGLTGEHERDGTAWKTEWAFLPDACHAAAAALAFGRELTAGLRVDAERMRANLDAQRGYVLAEPAMLALAAKVGKHRAHELVHRAALAGQEDGVTLHEALERDEEIGAQGLDLAALLRPENALGASGALVDAVLRRAGGGG